MARAWGNHINQNPYSGRSLRPNGLCKSIALLSVVLVIALTGRGYHRRMERLIRRVNLNGSAISNGIHEKKQSATNLEEPSWTWLDLDTVADALDTAAQGASGWIHEKTEGFLGEGIGNAIDYGDDDDGIYEDDEGVNSQRPEMLVPRNNDASEKSDNAEEQEQQALSKKAETEESIPRGETSRKPKEFSPQDKKDTKAGRLQVSTFNVASINNNPFEYWLTITENPAYEDLMAKVEEFIENPGERDVSISQVFTPEMFAELDERLVSVGWKSVKSYWETDFSERRIVSGFLKDESLGMKRLASMPDRITNTISTTDGKVVFRPTVINMYEKDLNDQETWWKLWQSFMFDQKLVVKDGEEEIKEKAPYEMLSPLERSKYPAVTEQEGADSLSLQTLCLAIFDGILVHMMNSVVAPDVWQPIKREIVENLTTKKIPRTIEILESQYVDSDILMLQEVSKGFIEDARRGNLGEYYHIIAPETLDVYRDQNSVIFLRKKSFPSGSGAEITDIVLSMFPKEVAVPVMSGDILAITAKHLNGDELVIASFHGDTNGLATIPVLDAIVAAVKKTSSGSKVHPKFLFGLDANTYESGKPNKTQDVMQWGAHYQSHGLTSCWGDVPQKSNFTTYNSRTYLQPQLNKACKRSEKREKGDVNPKDFVLFPKSEYRVIHTWKDNTGERVYKEDMAFPTLKFPSDHAILSTIIEPISETTGD